MPSESPLRSIDRLIIHRLAHGGDSNAFAEDVRVGLTANPKRLPPKYFYDELGSRLFEAICALPEYYLTRAESQILRNNAAEIISTVRGPMRLLEFGSGSSEKTRYLIQALLRRQSELQYVPVDISYSSLELASQELLRLYPQLRITAFAADYFTALDALREMRPANADLRSVAVFLGSNIGNFGPYESREFLRAVRSVLRRGDAMLLGADLKKSPDVLIAAYDDRLGVTASFDLNLLARMNHELQAEFDIAKFQHRAIYNAELGRIEIYITSRQQQIVRISALDFEVPFGLGESIHTENSYKFDLEQLGVLARDSGFSLANTWFDRVRLFSFNLLVERVPT